MSNIKNVHWFPGHMKKAMNEIQEKTKLVDIIIEVLDARAPLSSINMDLEKKILSKPRLYVITKADLADPDQLEKQKHYFLQNNTQVVVGSLFEKKFIDDIKKALIFLGKYKNEKDIKRGLKPQPIKVMVIGIPNAGKSTLINKLAFKKAAKVENRPGLTRSQQWIKVNDSLLLLDTPGILQTKYENAEKAAKLALIGSIREDILPFYDLADRLIDILFDLYGESFLTSRFDLKVDKDDKENIYKNIAEKRKLLVHKQDDISKAQKLLLREYKQGLLGRYNLEKI